MFRQGNAGLQGSGGRNLGLDVNGLGVWKEDSHPGLARSTCAEGKGAQERRPGEKLGGLLPYGMVED